MATMITNGDFVELDYTGSVKNDAGNTTVFDTTLEAVAKKNGLHNAKTAYAPAIICVGQHQLVRGIDTNLVQKEQGKEYQFDLSPEDAFGKKDAKLIQLVPTIKFRKQGINPVPGLQVNIDGNVGMIRKEGGGRTLVDFNHPLAGKEATYTVIVRRIVTDPAEKAKAAIRSMLPMKDVAVTVAGETATVQLTTTIPEQLLDILKAQVTKLVPSVHDVKFLQPAKQ